jgi:hypothetical protein
MTKSEPYRGFILSWDDPPLLGSSWQVIVATEDDRLFPLLRRLASPVMSGTDFTDVLQQAKLAIDTLVDGFGA